MKKHKVWSFLFLLMSVIALGVIIKTVFYANEQFKAETQAVDRTVTVYYGNSLKNPNAGDCGAVYPLDRKVPKDVSLDTVLRELFKGPTEAEKQEGYYSFFSTSTADILLGVKVVDSVAYVNLSDIRSPLGNASTSCGSQEFFSEIEKTIRTENLRVQKVIFAINGNPEAFYEWIQVGCSPENNNCDPTPFK